ncbi:hypothetical protein F442_05370 [Phytophthora nicotianae P10297]|uniref:Uncharacterized protein n=1 Tax=Phytophthora nicotianae P10297 TaxID=1317064 RepID=W2ZRY3_PHYNI|nr:hypothetical protein F442_05370 [Phytophthora nicotianae P10297]
MVTFLTSPQTRWPRHLDILSPIPACLVYQPPTFSKLVNRSPNRFQLVKIPPALFKFKLINKSQFLMKLVNKVTIFAGEEVTNSLQASEQVPKSPGISCNITNAASDIAETSKMTPRTTRRRLDIAFVNAGASQNLVVQLNPASNPAERPKEKKAKKKAKALKELDETKALAK